MRIDQVDRAILAELQKNSRISNMALAEAVGLSPSACSRRLDILEKNGAIRGYFAELAPEFTGQAMTIIVRVSLSGQSEKNLAEFEEAVQRCPNVQSCHLMSGDVDYVIRVTARDMTDYEHIHKEWLSTLPHVAKIHSSFALREIISRHIVPVTDAAETR